MGSSKIHCGRICGMEGTVIFGKSHVLQRSSDSRKWQPTPVFLPGELRGQKSLVNHSPWGHKELDTAEPLTLSCCFEVVPARGQLLVNRMKEG